MQFRLAHVALVAFSVASLVACGASTDEPEGVAAESSDALVVPAAARVGSLHAGESITVLYTGTPRYRAYSFVAAAGDAIVATAQSTDGDAVLWLTNASFSTLAKNDDEGAGLPNARITRTLKNAGTYWLVISEAKRKSATLTVSLARTNPVPVVSPGAPSPALTFNACPNNLGNDCVTLAGLCYDAYACPVQGFLDVQDHSGGTFHYDGQSLWPLENQTTSGTMAADETNQVFFRERHSVAVDGQEHGIATTLRHNDVFTTATRTPTGLDLKVRYVPVASGYYQNGATCSRPRTRGVGGYCTFHATLP